MENNKFSPALISLLCFEITQRIKNLSMNPKMFALLTVGVCSFLSSKADMIYKHNGETIECKVVAVESGSVKFIYKGETATHELGRYAINKIGYDSGREELISEKIILPPKDAEEKVIITTNPNEVVGLRQVEEIRSNSNNDFNFRGSKGLDEKATRKLRKEAASKNAFIIYLTADQAKSGSVFSTSSNTKRGICYTY